MRIGGSARYYAELKTQQDVQEAWQFAQEKSIPMIVLGAGSNTVFADGTIEALVVTIKASALEINGTTVRAEAGLPLATLVAKLAAHNLDLSALTGIPGTVGGATFGNAGQGPQGVWLDHFIDRVTAFADGAWRSFTRSECAFRYRESVFKGMASPLIWEVLLEVPSRPKAEVEAEITRLLKKRLESQPHTRTAGSCFKALPDGTPAWKAIDAAGLKGLKAGDLQVSEKHANFLINTGKGTFADVCALIETIRTRTQTPLALEMRLIEEAGTLLA
ncbi:MAG: UDP-N-acetylenolpyruvoylglucosamine reductase (MurB-like) [Candidatus Peribacter riflensis]|uniref:UDP-N-acetylenolpyruvoylglucosamine reductase n=1 Tax=Candidatus Peribacter riflensis TaxID=1735162 RepID=A0A0S1SRL3_9BACT|nr:MAG: UDP-N-acetylenolpyruvoylglucosamine reductase (MurB-like) [Candidatus Peribacter riflensis]ALM11462.1 MAG: UDP-N-acetylenolpyruvoylglucosamine reductase (MurB-like) [Candidatus Peribacter riflensis]ALM12564.1 MAG: UDP-N-acetylenolpyruvoylglucosamine reductase (MurB-like) [Candidatus Peribacter riflensis]ALM13665.1 MAG: UDP-N-acetylenolpyruvoylglucosamine reductase (MurB-like) [Candidatus Peribacter riflensis]ALM14768.1 MAG: UDP-N-acetylenolpyruvoylglucosamine reductase (MurB-like) [Cand